MECGRCHGEISDGDVMEYASDQLEMVEAVDVEEIKLLKVRPELTVLLWRRKFAGAGDMDSLTVEDALDALEEILR